MADDYRPIKCGKWIVRWRRVSCTCVYLYRHRKRRMRRQFRVGSWFSEPYV